MKPLTPLALLIADSTGIAQEVINLRPNQRFFLSNSSDIWIVESGEADLFSLERIQGQDEGPLANLAIIQPGSLLFGLPTTPVSEHISVLLIASKPLKLHRFSAAQFANVLTTHPEIIEEIESMLMQWINYFQPLISDFSIEQGSSAVKKETETTLQEGEIFLRAPAVDPKHKQDILWVQILSGWAQILNQPKCNLKNTNSIYPLTSKTWFRCLEPTTIKLVNTAEALQNPSLWDGLLQFHTHVLELILQFTEKQKQAAHDHIILRDQLEQELLDKTFDQMASVLHAQEHITATTGTNPLLAALHMIGEKLNIHFIEPKEMIEKARTEDKIAQICRSSQIRFRKVTLEQGWWKEDCGPLLGFYEQTDSPVALVQNKAGDYEILDPFTIEPLKITQEAYNTLSKTAYTFYQPFPEGSLTGISIIKFCLKSRWKEIGTILGAGVAGAVLSLFPPFANEILFNRVIKGGEMSILIEILIGLVVVAFSTTIFLMTRSYATLRLGQLIDAKLENALWDRILNLPATFFRNHTSGNLIQRIYAVTQMHQLLTGNALKVLLSGIFSVFYFIAMFNYSGKLAFLGLIVVFIALIISGTCIAFKTQIQRKILDVNGNLNGTLVQLILGIGKLRVAGAENRAFAYWSDQFVQSKRLQYKAQSIQNIVTITTSILPVLSSAVLFTGVVDMLTNAQGSSYLTPITIGGFIAFMAAYVPFSQAIFDAINTTINLVTVVPLWERAKVILQAIPEVSAVKRRLTKFNGEVSVDHLFFRYDKNGMTVLRDVSLHAGPGQFIGIVGPSGCGKSTLVRLLLGFETPEKGTISYDGIDMTTLDLREVRRKIGTVLQNGAVFSGSIHENIACGGSYTPAQVQHALELSGFSEDLKNLPMGLHTFLQSGGGTFSGGQAQRLLIARALITDPKVMIFDEATSALDTKTQDFITVNLDKLNVTRIVIAHRLTTVKNADLIYVMEKGSIVQKGTFAELSQQEGLFQQMLRRQSL